MELSHCGGLRIAIKEQRHHHGSTHVPESQNPAPLHKANLQTLAVILHAQTRPLSAQANHLLFHESFVAKHDMSHDISLERSLLDMAGYLQQACGYESSSFVEADFQLGCLPSQRKKQTTVENIVDEYKDTPNTDKRHQKMLAQRIRNNFDALTLDPTLQKTTMAFEGLTEYKNELEEKAMTSSGNTSALLSDAVALVTLATTNIEKRKNALEKRAFDQSPPHLSR
jgi:hypothetical protein